MNAELLDLINLTLSKGDITDKEREVIYKKAEKLGEDIEEVELVINNKLAQKQKNVLMDMTNFINDSSNFPIPLGAGWIINSAAWSFFIFTRSNTLEIIFGLLCGVAAFIAYKHKLLNSPAWLDMKQFSPNNLLYVSIFNAIWMFSWGFSRF